MFGKLFKYVPQLSFTQEILFKKCKRHSPRRILEKCERINRYIIKFSKLETTEGRKTNATGHKHPFIK
jgi:hypothetical protein